MWIKHSNTHWNELCPFQEMTGFTLTLEKDPQISNYEESSENGEKFCPSKFDPATVIISANCSFWLIQQQWHAYTVPSRRLLQYGHFRFDGHVPYYILPFWYCQSLGNMRFLCSEQMNYVNDMLDLFQIWSCYTHIHIYLYAIYIHTALYVEICNLRERTLS